MAHSLSAKISSLASIDIFSREKGARYPSCGEFVGRPFHVDYDRMHVLVADAWKFKAKGIPQGSFLLAYYENEENVAEALLLRVLHPASLPTDPDVISSMVEYYKDNLRTTGTSVVSHKQLYND